MMLKSEPEFTKPRGSAGLNQSEIQDYHRLRSLVLGDEYEKILSARASDDDINRVAKVLSEAFKKRRSIDDSLAREMSPVIESAIDESIKSNPEKITQVIFPIIGPAVRKAVTTALADLMQSLNYLLQNSLSIKALIWRLKAWRLGIDYGEYVLLQSIQYQVEQVFLIHRETGLLIKSVQAEGVIYQDPDLVSSMLTAISDFATDSFEHEDGGLDVVQMGDLSLLIEVGPHAILALAVRGVIHHDVKSISTHLIETVHAKFSSELKSFDGNTELFEPIKALLDEALIHKVGSQDAGQEAIQDESSQNSENTTKPWLAIIAVILIFISIGYFSYQNYQLERSIQQVILKVNQEKGYRVLSSQYQNQQLILDVLRSGIAAPINSIQEKLNTEDITLVIKETLASIDEFEIYLPYLSQKYQAELSIIEGSHNKILVSGEISKTNIKAIANDRFILSMYELVIDPALIITPDRSLKESSQQAFFKKVKTINSQLYYFETASAILTETSQSALAEQIRLLKDIIRLQQDAAIEIIQIGVFGFADAVGNEANNVELSQARAKVIKSILIENEIIQNLIISWGAGSVDSDNVPIEYQRRARIEVLYTLGGATDNDK
jgi:outer membrane protein OmpA-like peptidoglycan-associated protein